MKENIDRRVTGAEWRRLGDTVDTNEGKQERRNKTKQKRRRRNYQNKTGNKS